MNDLSGEAVNTSMTRELSEENVRKVIREEIKKNCKGIEKQIKELKKILLKQSK